MYYDGVYAYLGDQDKEFILIDFEADEPIGYVVRSPNVDWLGAVPIVFLSVGITLMVFPYFRAKMKNS